MSERPEVTTLRFIEESWTSQPQVAERLIAELVSVAKETNRKPDTYHFDISGGVLIDPETGRPILDFIAPGVEYKIAEELQIWAAETDEGIAWWISPKLAGVYPCNKVIVHQLAYKPSGEKVLLNSAILFDGDLDDPENLRETLFSALDNDQVLHNILLWIEKVSGQKVDEPEYQGSEKQEASYFAYQIRSGVDPRLIVEEMRASGFLGGNSISCPVGPSFGGIIESRARIFMFSGEKSWTPGECRVCEKHKEKVGPCGICDDCESEFD